MVFAGSETGESVLVTEFRRMALNGLFSADVLRPLDLVPLTDFTYKWVLQVHGLQNDRRSSVAGKRIGSGKKRSDHYACVSPVHEHDTRLREDSSRYAYVIQVQCQQYFTFYFIFTFIYLGFYCINFCFWRIKMLIRLWADRKTGLLIICNKCEWNKSSINFFYSRWQA